jgi:transcriptional regulator with XRE-family HTH domain
MFDRAQLIVKLKDMAESAGSQLALAKQLGISTSYLSDVLNGRQEPSKALLVPLGFERVTFYRKVK